MSEKPRHFEYDERADVLYVNFGFDELSISNEINEDLVVDIGYYSGLVTGFRVISPRRKKISVSLIVEKMIPRVQRIAKKRVRESLGPVENLKPRQSRSELKTLLATS